MADNAPLRRPTEGWANAFRRWMSDPGLDGSIFSSIVFDYRRVTGPLDVEPLLDQVVRTAPQYPVFLRHLGRRALDERPPTGFFRDFVVEAKGDHAGKLDVKHRGIILIGDLARAYAISAGRNEKSTLRRLRVATENDVIDDDIRAGLEEAFRFLWALRLEHQAAMWQAGEPPDDFIDPRELGSVARRGLKEAFQIIRRAQKVLAADLGVSP